MSDLFYVNKIIVYKPFNVSLLHLVDDECNEFIATAFGVNYMTGYVGTNGVCILKLEEYDREKWEDIARNVEYERGDVL